jgi:hypothetical protein
LKTASAQVAQRASHNRHGVPGGLGCRSLEKRESEIVMSTHRETYYTCTYASTATRRTAVVPAWDATMAESVFRELLAEEPLDDAGVIEIELPGGRVARRAQYEPRAA